MKITRFHGQAAPKKWKCLYIVVLAYSTVRVNGHLMVSPQTLNRHLEMAQAQITRLPNGKKTTGYLGGETIFAGAVKITTW